MDMPPEFDARNNFYLISPEGNISTTDISVSLSKSQHIARAPPPEQNSGDATGHRLYTGIVIRTVCLSVVASIDGRRPILAAFYDMLLS